MRSDFHTSILHTTIPQFFKPLMDSIITKGMTVRDFKKQIIKEAYKQGVEYPLQLDRYTLHTPLEVCLSVTISHCCRLRLRKKTWRTASTVFLDNQIFEKDIHIFTNFEIYVEPLEGTWQSLAHVLLIATRATNSHTCY